MRVILDHFSEIPGQSAGDGEDGEDLDEIAQGIGVFKGMGGVGVEESATVGTEHFDGDLRSDGALRDCLLDGL